MRRACYVITDMAVLKTLLALRTRQVPRWVPVLWLYQWCRDLGMVLVIVLVVLGCAWWSSRMLP